MREIIERKIAKLALGLIRIPSREDGAETKP